MNEIFLKQETSSFEEELALSMVKKVQPMTPIDAVLGHFQSIIGDPVRSLSGNKTRITMYNCKKRWVCDFVFDLSNGKLEIGGPTMGPSLGWHGQHKHFDMCSPTFFQDVKKKVLSLFLYSLYEKPTHA